MAEVALSGIGLRNSAFMYTSPLARNDEIKQIIENNENALKEEAKRLGVEDSKRYVYKHSL